MEAHLRREFEPRLESVADARRFLSSVLSPAELGSAAFIEVAELLTSELVSNAVLHARTSFDVCIDVVEIEDGVLISVIDHSPVLPVLRQPDLEAPGGRGMLLVDRLSAAWGVVAGDASKRVWCRVVPQQIRVLAQV